MSVIKNIFVCEFITAGGLNHTELPAKLANEGALMRDALLRDLASLPYHILTSVDFRLKPPPNCDTILVQAGDDVWKIWLRLIQNADAVWLIAPETDGLLEQLTALAIHSGKSVFGSGLQAITVTSSKLNTFATLNPYGIKILPTYTVRQFLQLTYDAGQSPEKWPTSWVVKPDDGAGCEQTYLFSDSDKILQWLSSNKTDDRARSKVVQPYVTGQPASISCIMHQGQVRVLSCNQQLISIENGVFNYHGSRINGLCEHWTACETLASQVAQALPELAGYVGIDVVVRDIQGELEVILIEINPRLTTSYAGLAAAIDYNPASLVIDFMTKGNFEWPVLQKNQVTISI